MTEKKAPNIAMKAVAKSTSLTHHGYDPETKTLAITFRGGKTYRYEGVSPELYADMGKAESAGKFVATHIVGKFTHASAGSKKPA